MRSFFDFLTRTALRFRAVTIAIVAAVMVLGGVSATQLNQELLPPIEFPQTFVVAPVSGLTAEQGLTIITERIEAAILDVPEVVNVESQTSSQVIFLTVSNDFGLDQEQLRADIEAAIDSVYFPTRQISFPDGGSPEAFAQRLVGDLTSDVLIYLEGLDRNFIFQLPPEFWGMLSDETLNDVLAYLAQREIETTDTSSALERLVEQSVVPQLENIDVVVNVSVEGGQVLPGEDVAGLSETATVTETTSLLLQLSPEAWDVIASRLDDVSELDETAVDVLSQRDINVPDEPPTLPASWQTDGFEDASDLTEMASFTQSLSGVITDFLETGVIEGSIAETDDLTAETIRRMLEIEPTLAESFDAEQLVALPPEVFAALPADLEFDGFTRDALAATSLARAITGDVVQPEPVDLPAAWVISSPTLISFSFADLPLATFSVFSTAAPEDFTTDETSQQDETDSESNTDEVADASSDSGQSDTSTATTDAPNYPEGPALPELFTALGDLSGFEMDTADDALALQLPQEAAGFLGGTDIVALLNFLPQISQFSDQLTNTSGGEDAEATVPVDFAQVGQLTAALGSCGLNPLQLGILGGDINFDALAEGLIGCISPETMSYVVAQEPTLPAQLSPQVYSLLSPDVLAVEGVSPTLGEAWNSLAARPEFDDISLQDADDVIALGDGSAASFLNTVNTEIPERYAGYEVRLFDSLTPTILAYFAQNEDSFYQTLSNDVLLKLSPEALAALPATALDRLAPDVAEQVNAIASGDVQSAAEELSSQYATDTIPPREDAPELNEGWQGAANFFNIELENAYDFFRFPDVIESPATWINGFFDSAQGAAFITDLLANMPADAFFYIVNEDPNFINELSPRVLRLLPSEIFDQLPESARERAEEGQVFVPNTAVTRTNGAPSLLVTVFKDSDANTVSAYAQVEALMTELDANNDTIAVEVAFEQSSFIEESIAGVVRDGTLGAFFAIINILIFLSGDTWGRRGRLITGVVVSVVSSLIFMFIFAQAGSLEGMIDEQYVLFSAIALLGIIAGAGIVLLPGRLPYPSWRSTLVIAVSIPLSIMSSLALMRWLPVVMNGILGPVSGNVIVDFVLKLAPENLTLNIMTLSGLTVAVGRLVDDSIVVLENIFKQLQVDSSTDKKEVVLQATRDVSVAIFSATSIAVIVFLPLGLTGGLIAEFFLPFGLAVTYTLVSSFLIAITVVPVLAYLFISAENVPKNEETWMERAYVPTLRFVLSKPIIRWGVIGLALVSVGLSFFLFGQRPAAFLPEFGEPQLSVSVNMPEGTTIIETNDLVEEMETAISNIIPEGDLSTVRATIGGGGLSFDALIGGGGVSENVADITIGVNNSESLNQYLEQLEARAIEIFGDESVTVSAGTLSEGGFGGFQLLLSAEDDSIDQVTLEQYNDDIINTLEALPDIQNVTSNLTTEAEATAGDDDAPTTFIRVNARPALTYTGEVLTEDTINFTTEAIEAIQEQVDLPEGVSIGQGFDSELQTEGFASIIVAMGIASVLIIAILMIVFRSPIYWLAVIGSVVVAPVGAAIALTLTDRVLGISALIGLLMLLGLVVTNAIVLIDRVSSNRHERGMPLYEAIVEAGGRRVRPIIMTALTTIIGLIPLSLGLSEGAIIAAELGTVVIGGVISSTLLMLIVVPTAYYLLTPLHDFLMGNRDAEIDPEKAKNE